MLFHCGMFRPTYSCMMKQSGASFCVVCLRQIRNTLRPLTGFETWPADQEQYVDPWPARLQWRTGLLENSWEFQITDEPDFSGAQPIVTTKTDVVANEKVAYEYEWLVPNKEYQWRLRKVGASAWTEPRSFTTTAKKVMLKSPRSDDRTGLQYPWELAFDWYEVDGAEYYEVEVLDSSNNPIFPTVESDLGELSVTLNVKVKANLHWHARAIPSQGIQYAGTWSDSFPFITSWPKVEISKPGNGTYPHPWPVTLEWNKVDGAAKYKVEIERKKNKDQWGPISQQKSLEFDQSTLSVDLNLKPRHNSEHEEHKWKVRVWGPPLGPAGAEGTGEEGEDSGLYTFYNGGDKTIPKPISTAVDPTMSLAGLAGNLNADQMMWLKDGSILLKWKGVKQAEAYRVRVMSFHDVSAPAPEQVALEKELHPATDYDPTASEIDFMADESALDPPPAVGMIAYSWNAIAVGPEDLESPFDWTWYFVIWPDPPNLTAPAQSATGLDYRNINFAFTSPYSPSGKYRVTLSDGVTTHDVVITGHPGGTTKFGIDAFGQAN